MSANLPFQIPGLHTQRETQNVGCTTKTLIAQMGINIIRAVLIHNSKSFPFNLTFKIMLFKNVHEISDVVQHPVHRTTPNALYFTCGQLHDTTLSPIPLMLGDSSSRWHLSTLGPLRDTHLAVFSPKIGHNSWGSYE